MSLVQNKAPRRPYADASGAVAPCSAPLPLNDLRHFCSRRARLGLRTQQFLSAWGTRSSRATWSGVPASLEQQFLRACKNAQL